MGSGIILENFVIYKGPFTNQHPTLHGSSMSQADALEEQIEITGEDLDRRPSPLSSHTAAELFEALGLLGYAMGSNAPASPTDTQPVDATATAPAVDPKAKASAPAGCPFSPFTPQQGKAQGTPVVGPPIQIASNTSAQPATQPQGPTIIPAVDAQTAQNQAADPMAGQSSTAGVVPSVPMDHLGPVLQQMVQDAMNMSPAPKAPPVPLTPSAATTAVPCTGALPKSAASTGQHPMVPCQQ